MTKEKVKSEDAYAMSIPQMPKIEITPGEIDLGNFLSVTAEIGRVYNRLAKIAALPSAEIEIQRLQRQMDYLMQLKEAWEKRNPIKGLI